MLVKNIIIYYSLRRIIAKRNSLFQLLISLPSIKVIYNYKTLLQVVKNNKKQNCMHCFFFSFATTSTLNKGTTVIIKLKCTSISLSVALSELYLESIQENNMNNIPEIKRPHYQIKSYIALLQCFLLLYNSQVYYYYFLKSSNTLATRPPFIQKYSGGHLR